MHRISKTNANRYLGVDFSEIFESAAIAPGIRLEGNRYDRHIGAFGEFDTQRIEFMAIKLNAAGGLRK